MDIGKDTGGVSVFPLPTRRDTMDTSGYRTRGWILVGESYSFALGRGIMDALPISMHWFRLGFAVVLRP